MTEKELKKLNRYQLLELLVESTKRADELQLQVNELQSKLDQQEVKMSHLGSIADAALQVNGVFDAAQKAADMYLKSAVQQADEIIAFANRQAASIVLQAEDQTRHISWVKQYHKDQSGK